MKDITGISFGFIDFKKIPGHPGLNIFQAAQQQFEGFRPFWSTVKCVGHRNHLVPGRVVIKVLGISSQKKKINQGSSSKPFLAFVSFLKMHSPSILFLKS